jgi:hypothetical protein
MIVKEGGLDEIPFSRAGSKAVQVNHYRVAVTVVEHVPDVRVPVDYSSRQHKIKPGIFVLQPY